MKEIAIASLCNLTFVTSTHASQPTAGVYVSADANYRYIDGGKLLRSQSDGIDTAKVKIEAASNETDAGCCI